jgi:hypothetical protein
VSGFDAGDADVVCCQEVFTYWHLRLPVRRMRSFRRVSYRPGPFGPNGGLVTFSLRPVSGTAFRHFGRPPRGPRRSREIPFAGQAERRPLTADRACCTVAPSLAFVRADAITCRVGIRRMIHEQTVGVALHSCFYGLTERCVVMLGTYSRYLSLWRLTYG